MNLLILKKLFFAFQQGFNYQINMGNINTDTDILINPSMFIKVTFRFRNYDSFVFIYRGIYINFILFFNNWHFNIFLMFFAQFTPVRKTLQEVRIKLKGLFRQIVCQLKRTASFNQYRLNRGIS